MSAKDDVKTDLSDAYDGMTRADVDTVMRMLAQAPAGHAGSSVGAALKGAFPAAFQRLEGASEADQTEYMRALKQAGVFIQGAWRADGQRPELAHVLGAIDDAEGEG